jgi:N-acetylmuramoyl-L-alanine amidase
MSAAPTRIDAPPPGANAPTTLLPSGTPHPGFSAQAGNRVLESIARRQALPSLLAFSALHEQIERSADVPQATADLAQTERFIFDEVLQLLCERAQAITRADGVIVALSQGSAFVCRAASGMMAVERGVHLVPDSKVLKESVESKRICFTDNCAEPRAELDLSRVLGAGSTVIVPLRGSHAVLGVLQVFAQKPSAFSDDDLRTLDFFAELLLSALKPGDEHRRLNWLADVANSILVPRTNALAAIDERPVEDETIEESDLLDTGVAIEHEIAAHTPEALPVIDETFSESRVRDQKLPRRFLTVLSFPIASRPGLAGVLALVAVAALFSAGVWWGMLNHVTPSQKSSALVSPQSTNNPPAAASTAAPSVPDHLLDPAKSDTESASATPPGTDQLAALPRITGLRHWSSSVGSTVVIDMEDQVPYEVHRLTSPERIYFDLHDTRLASDLDGKSIDVSDSSLTRVRVAQPVAGVTRVVLDTRNGSNFSVSMESSPYRLVVELRDGAKAQTFTPTRPPAESSRPQSAQTALLVPNAKRDDDQSKIAAGHFHIVLDAGHGGWDLGTVGHNGLLEKDLVLDVTERLGKLLKSRLGADVIFTRATDDYLPLDQRAEIANQAQADLFISVHANYSKLESARGVETYYTNFFSAPGSREIENRENGSSARPTPVALSASELHDKIEQSRQLAASVQRSLYSTLSTRNPGIRDRGVKDSAFVVLTGTTMPAILTEISFVSSPADVRNLRSESYRQQIAEALYNGISRYEAGMHHHVKMAQVRGTSAAQ